jgi:hypothetical protein
MVKDHLGDISIDRKTTGLLWVGSNRFRMRTSSGYYEQSNEISVS